MKNTREHYGKLTIFLHWLVALMVFSLFGLGLWMVDLGYYDSWYKTAPELHKSFGILLFVTMLIRLLVKYVQISPTPLASYSAAEKKIGGIMHGALYLVIFVLMISGYLISTADSRGIEVFSWFTVPSLGELFEQQEDIAGLIHEYVAYTLIAMVVLHVLAALKHHFLDKDKTLLRMLGNRR